MTPAGANATQTITTETQDLGGVTLTKVTREVVLETGGGGTTWSSIQEPVKRDDDAINQRPATFHVPKINAQPLRWQPDGGSSASAADKGDAVARILVNRPVTVDVSPIGASAGREEGAPRVKAFARVEPSREEQATFKVPKTTAKPWVWQPSFVPSLPVREASPTLAFQILEASTTAAPYENHVATREENAGRGGGRSSDDLGLSPDLIRVLTTEGQEDDWAAIMRKSQSLCAQSYAWADHTAKIMTIRLMMAMMTTLIMVLLRVMVVRTMMMVDWG